MSECPYCGSRVYRTSRSGKQVYKCNDLTDIDCPFAHEAVGRTKAQVRRAGIDTEIAHELTDGQLPK